MWLVHNFIATFNPASSPITFLLSRSEAASCIIKNIFGQRTSVCPWIGENREAQIKKHGYRVTSLIPRPPPFLPSIRIHSNTRKWSSTPVNANGSQKQGGLGTRLVTLYPCFFICASLFSLSYSWTDTCPLTKNVLDYASSVVINNLWPTVKLSSLQMWSGELAGLEVAMKLCTCLL